MSGTDRNIALFSFFIPCNIFQIINNVLLQCHTLSAPLSATMLGYGIDVVF